MKHLSNQYIPFDTASREGIVARNILNRLDGCKTELGVKLLTVATIESLSSFMLSRDIYTLVTLYEDLLDAPSRYIQDLFSALEIPEMYVDQVTAAVAKDLLNINSECSSLKRTKSNLLTKSELDFIDFYFRDCGIPLAHDSSVEDYWNYINL